MAVTRWAEGLASSLAKMRFTEDGARPLGALGDTTQQPEFGTMIAMGGACASLWSASSVTILDGEFVNNTAAGAAMNWGGSVGSVGGHVFVEATHFRNNSAVGGYHAAGGALYCIFCDLHVSRDTEFARNEAVCLSPDWLPATLAASGLTLHGMFAQGGALFLHSTTATIQSTRFVANVAQDALRVAAAGAIFLTIDSELVLADCWLESNEARDSDRFCGGGAIKIESSARLVINTTTFKSNAAKFGKHTTGGGAIEVDGASVVLGAGVHFVENFATNLHTSMSQYVSGGAIRIHNPPATLTAVEGPSFLKNLCNGTDPNGGAITIDGDMRLEFATFVSNSVIADFESGGGGGAIAVLAGSSSLKGCSFIGNMHVSKGPGRSGGALFVSSNGKVSPFESLLRIDE